MPYLALRDNVKIYYSMVAVDYIREHVKGSFTLEKNFAGTTHNVIQQAPHEVAERVKAFMVATK